MEGVFLIVEKLTVNSNKVDAVRYFRMYKDGKKWIVAGTSVLAFGRLGLSNVDDCVHG